MAVQANIIEDGIHYLSGIGSTTYHDDWNNEDIDVELFCIDDVIYGAYIDPEDGYRSYGRITAATDIADCKCQFTFPPQKVIVENVHTKIEDEYGIATDAYKLVIKDAILNKEELVVGTDYSDDYYPCAIFSYQPMNLYANVEKSAKGFVS